MEKLLNILILTTALIFIVWWFVIGKKDKVATFFKDAGYRDIRRNDQTYKGRLNDLSYEIELERYGGGHHQICGSGYWLTWITAPVNYKGPTLSFSPIFFNNYPDWDGLSVDLGRGEPLKEEEITILKTIFEQLFQQFEIENGQIRELFPRIELNIEDGQFIVRYSGFPKKSIVALVKLLDLLRKNIDKVQNSVQQLHRGGL